MAFALNETTTNITISKKTAKILEHLRKNLSAKSFDAVIQSLIKNYRNTILEKNFALDRDRIKPFSEEDRD